MHDDNGVVMRAIRQTLFDSVDYTTLVLVHHAQNAARAKTYASQGRRETARWYGQRAREDLASYLKWRLGAQT